MKTTVRYFLSKFKHLLEHISHIGSQTITDDRLRRKVILSNQFSVTATCVLICIGLRLAYEIGPIVVPGYVLAALAYSAVLILNKKGYYNASRLYITMLPTINLLMVTCLTTDDTCVSTKFSFISIIAVPLVLFDLTEKRLLIFGVLWVVMMFYLTDLLNPLIPHVYANKVSDVDNYGIINRNAFMSFILISMGCIYLQRLNIHAEKKIYSLFQESNEQKLILEEKNHTITQSITYARYIQKAVLSRPEVLTGYCSDHFLLFQPKDIVSGDFWLFKTFDNKLVVSVADGTGHGVPGAFLSMLGISFLSEVVRKSQNNTPAQALVDLRSQIKLALHQQDFSSELHDGMDMALVYIDTQTGIAEFAGARRPLLLIKASNPKEIVEYKPDRMPIGIYETETAFTNHSIKLEKGDTLYLFTDGYEDQFGEVANVRYKSKTFRETLLSIQSMSMSEQRNHLETIHRKWRGGEDQTDDILVVGIKI